MATWLMDWRMTFPLFAAVLLVSASCT
ncbi:MAG: hypothetical protein RLZZ214_3576, partial [Verrucomicrobiota bacterium]